MCSQRASGRRWAEDEDGRLRAAVETHDAGKWADIENAFGGGRTAAMCRERWHYNLRPDVRKRDTAVSKQLRGRSAHAVRNRCALLRNQAAREEGTCPPLDDSPHGNARADGSFGFVSGACPAPPVARLLQPTNAHVGLLMPAVQQATPVAAPMFPRAPSFRSFDSTTTTTMMPLSIFPPTPQPTWLALGPAAPKADSEGKIPFMATAAVGLDATLEGNCHAWIAAVDAAILELGHVALAVA
jgi:hypothetical protein